MEHVVKTIKPAAGSGNELKPCPFCGSNEIVFMLYEHAAGLRWRVFCCGCTATIDPGYAQEMHTVADLWNKRIKEA